LGGISTPRCSVKALDDVLQIKLVMTDIDGVWTDGGMYYGAQGECMKRFNTRDGAAVARLREIGIETVIVTREDSDIVRARARKLEIEHCHCGVTGKGAVLSDVCGQFQVRPDEIAYIGDDVYDLPLLERVGMSACPADAVEEVRRMVDYVCERKGGEGAFRELADLIIKRQTDV